MKRSRQLAAWRCLGVGALWLIIAGCGVKDPPTPPNPPSDPPTVKLVPLRHYLASTQAYWQTRASLIESQRLGYFSARIQLDADELKASDYIESLRIRESDPYHTNGVFPPARRFHNAKPDIDRSEMFRVLSQMPKGGALHLHWPAIGPVSWIISNATYRPDCYVKWNTPTNDPMLGQLHLQATTNGLSSNFVAATVLRAQLQAEGRSLDQELTSRFMLRSEAASTSKVWEEFGNCFQRIWDFATYEPLFSNYLTAGIQSFIDDKVHYLEIRTPVVPLNDGNGNSGELTNFLRSFHWVRNAVREKNPEFNLKLILADTRDAPATNVSTLLADAERYREMFPDLIVGCDLVGDEDTGHTTAHFVPQLCAFAYTNRALHFFFHDGESAWPDDNNIIDAVLLGSKRIGHGFNLFRWPEVETMIRQQSIALEVCPISNQALLLAPDLRLHPASGYLRRGVQCVLSSDDPAILGNHGLSYDFWMAVMGWNIRLPALKQLAENSLFYSAMTETERDATLVVWRQRWKEWIAWLNTEAQANARP